MPASLSASRQLSAFCETQLTCNQWRRLARGRAGGEHASQFVSVWRQTSSLDGEFRLFFVVSFSSADFRSSAKVWPAIGQTCGRTNWPSLNWGKKILMNERQIKQLSYAPHSERQNNSRPREQQQQRRPTSWNLYPCLIGSGAKANKRWTLGSDRDQLNRTHSFRAGKRAHQLSAKYH